MAKKNETRLLVTQVRSTISCKADQKATIKALGLRGINSSIEHVSSPALDGMLFKVKHLIKVEELN